MLRAWLSATRDLTNFATVSSGPLPQWSTNAGAWDRAINSSMTPRAARKNNLLAGVARSGAEVLGPATPAGGRLMKMGRLLERLGEDMIRAAERLRAEED